MTCMTPQTAHGATRYSAWHLTHRSLMLMLMLMRLMVLARWMIVATLALVVIAHQPAYAHKPSDSYLTLTARDAGVIDVSWHIALRDLDTELHLDADDDGRLTWGEVRARWPDIQRYARGYLSLRHEGQACEASPLASSASLATHTDGRYAVLNWSYQCPLQAGQTWQSVDIDYRLFALTDPTHRGIVHWRSIGGTRAAPIEGGTVVLGEPRPGHSLALVGLTGVAWSPSSSLSPPSSSVAASASAAAPGTGRNADADLPTTEATWHQLARFTQDGIHHIAIGADHILFLLSLLLVSVWQRRPAPIASRWSWMGGWQARPQWTAALTEVLKLVTAFTVAHSITLALAAFGILSPPSRVVESLIAFSVLLAALDNVMPLLHGPRWIVALLFGLVHGFGFAGALQDLDLSGSALAVPLLGFNLGVELGQLTLVALCLPIACMLRRTALYRHVVAGAGSVVIAAIASIWLIERVADITIWGWGG